MHLNRCTLFLVVGSVCAVYLPFTPGHERLIQRSDPAFKSPQVSGPAHFGDLQKRTDPTFRHPNNFGVDWNGTSKKDSLEASFQDVYTLAAMAINHFDIDIFTRWFPAENEEGVKAVITSVVESTEPNFDPLSPTALEYEGAADLAWLFITPVDFNAGTGDDFCADGADAYTENAATGGTIAGISTGIAPFRWARVHFCDITFGSEQDEQALLLDELECNDFYLTNDDGTKSYRLTNEMESLAATVFHEMMHFNRIGIHSGLPVVSDSRSIIGDQEESKIGNPWASWNLRKTNPDKSLYNADSYLWFALETYWTSKCSDQLQSQGGKFHAPKDDSDE